MPCEQRARSGGAGTGGRGAAAHVRWPVEDRRVGESSSTRRQARLRLTTMFGSYEPSRSQGTLILHRANVGQHRLAPAAVTGVAAIPAAASCLWVAAAVGELALVSWATAHPHRSAAAPAGRLDQAVEQGHRGPHDARTLTIAVAHKG